MVKKIITSEFFKASFWVFLATGVLSAGNYFYHLLMGRMLGPEFYGVLESVISLFYIISIPFIPLTLVIVKFVSRYKGKHDKEAISSFYNYIRNKIFLYGIIATLGILIALPLIMSFLHINNLYFQIFMVLGFFIGLLSVLVKGTLQGIFNFFAIFVANTTETVGKLAIAVILVYLGFKALGAFVAIILALLIGLVVSFFFIKKERLSSIGEFKDGREIFKYSIPVFLTMLGLTSLFTTDVILVRNLFSGVESGYYAALSVLGKVIFFATFPVTMVLFPLISEKRAADKEYKNLLLTGIILALVISGGIVLLYYFLPKIMVVLLFGEKYISIAPLLATFGIFIAIYSFCSLLANFYLSIHKTMIYVFVLAASILQIILILLFHKSLSEVINMSILSSAMLLASLIIYYPIAVKEKIRTNRAEF